MRNRIGALIAVAGLMPGVLGLSATAAAAGSRDSVHVFLTGTVAFAPSSAWTVGWGGVGSATADAQSLHWDGTKWVSVKTVNYGTTINGLMGVSATGPADMWGVGLLPHIMARVHPRFGTPSVATHVQMALAIAYALGVGFAFGDPLKALVFQGTISTILIIAIYMTTGLSCIAYYLRERRAEFNVLLHGLIPLAVFVLFIPVLLAALGVDFAGLGITPLAFPANDARYVIYAWLAAGLLVLAYFLVTDRSRIARTGQIFDEPAIQAELHHEAETSDQPDTARRRGAA